MYDNEAGWFIPDDLVQHLEHPEDCARRILKEQAGITREKLQLNHMESFTGHDGTWHLIFHYAWEAEKTLQITPGKNVRSFAWFDLKALPKPSEVSHHGWAISVLNRICRKA